MIIAEHGSRRGRPRRQLDESDRRGRRLQRLERARGVRRVSQLARLQVCDLQADRTRLMIPTSRKGRGTRKLLHRPVPIPASLAVRLRSNRPDDAPLLLKPSGGPWRQSDQTLPFQRVAIRAGLDPAEVTMCALRHSNIVRQLLRGVPTRVVAANHDTSVAMLERTYSRHITDHSDQLTRVTLLDLA
jgi:integrase